MEEQEKESTELREEKESSFQSTTQNEEDESAELMKQITEGDVDITPLAKEKQEIMQFDTSEEFAEVFGSKTEFDSWEEFSKCLEEFQLKTGTTFKPRSACSIDYANERRISGPIPPRFVYANVKMICFHFGTSTKRGPGQKRNYVGLGCEAFMNVSYNKGALRITQSHLIHNNHEALFEADQSLQRPFRVFNFSEELDVMIGREVLKVNPFEYPNGEKQWIKAVERLKNSDDRFANITPRLVKKRIRFLIDKFLVISHGRRPSPDDEMGGILYELDRTKKDTMDSLVVHGKKKRGRGRPRKRPPSDEEDFDEEDLIETSPVKKRLRASPPSASQTTSSEMSVLLSYLQRKDEEDRKQRQREMEEDKRLRMREMDLRKEELTFQRERFEYEKAERRQHLDFMKSQLQVFEHSLMAKQTAVIPAKDANQVTEYTIVVDNNNQVIESLPTLS